MVHAFNPVLERNIRQEETGAQSQSAVALRTGLPNFDRGKNSLEVDCFVFLIFSLNPNIWLWVFIIYATLPEQLGCPILAKRPQDVPETSVILVITYKRLCPSLQEFAGL